MLAVVVDEARKHDLDVMVHAVTAPAMLAAIEAGAAKLVHTPHDSFLTNEQAKLVADAGIENLSTVGFAVPVFDVFNHDNVPTFRDGSPWPSGILGHGLERGRREGRQRAHAVGQRRRLRLRHRHELLAARRALSRAEGAEPDVLAARHRQAHGAEHGRVHRDDATTWARSRPARSRISRSSTAIR